MVFHIITLFPEAFGSYLKESIIGRALGKANQHGSKRRLTLIKANKHKLISVKFYNPRDFVKNAKGKDKNYRQVDDRPYGGGPGMVMQIEPLVKAVQSAKSKIKNQKSKIKVVLFEAGGKQFDNKKAKNLAKSYTDLILVCGRYEGIDARLKKVIKDQGLSVDELSIGPYVLTGGELAAEIVIDSVSRQIPGVLHKTDSLEEKRFGIGVPSYTRPETFKFKRKIYKVPKILLSGHQAKIKEWKKIRIPRIKY